MKAESWSSQKPHFFINVWKHDFLFFKYNNQKVKQTLTNNIISFYQNKRNQLLE